MQEPTDDGGTGDAQVDEAVRTLDTLDGLPVHEHATVFERVHEVLQDRLTGDLDETPDLDDTGNPDDTGDFDARSDPGAEGRSGYTRPGGGEG